MLRLCLIFPSLAAVCLAGPLEDLRSDQARIRAWGAFRAGEAALDEAVPALRKALKDDHGSVQRAALDALIRLKAKVGAQELQHLRKTNPTEVTILFALHPREHRDSLRALVHEKARYGHWLIACNLLATARDPGLAEKLLDGIPLWVDVRVSDEIILFGTGRGGRGGGRGGRCRVIRAKGWPPFVAYSLTAVQDAASEPLAPGLYPIYYKRTVIQKTGWYGESRIRWLDRTDARLEYLAQLAGAPLPIRKTTCKSIVWKDAATLQRDLERVRATVRANFKKLAADLVARKLLDKEAAARLEPTIKMRVDDKRANREPPLPRFP